MRGTPLIVDPIDSISDEIGQAGSDLMSQGFENMGARMSTVLGK
jgi:hypothetical protein